MEIQVVSTIKKGVGKKSGKPYVSVEIPISESYSKVVFLEEVERALFEVTYENN